MRYPLHDYPQHYGTGVVLYHRKPFDALRIYR